MKEKLQIHESMRGYFSYALYKEMENNLDIWVVAGDLGYGMLNSIRKDFPDRFINTGASEQTMMGVAIGLAMEEKIPVVYSITPFLLYRPFETIRNYINREEWPVKLVGSGRDKDYLHDGFSHWSHDAKTVLDNAFPNIKQYWPGTKYDIPNIMNDFLYNSRPSFISLRR